MVLPGLNVRGAKNTARLRIASMADFIVMKAHAIGGRDKPKDAYDFCYCLDHAPGGIAPLAKEWKTGIEESDIKRAMAILIERFSARIRMSDLGEPLASQGIPTCCKPVRIS